MTYIVISERCGADSCIDDSEVETIYDARAAFNHRVAMAIQHGEWDRVQVLQKPNERNPFPSPIMAYNPNGVDVQVINQEDEKYQWLDPETGTTWTRPTAHAYAMMCKAYNRYRYGEGTPKPMYAVKELGSDKLVVTYLLDGQTKFRYTSNEQEATHYEDRSDAARAIRVMIRANEAGDFDIVPILSSQN